MVTVRSRLFPLRKAGNHRRFLKQIMPITLVSNLTKTRGAKEPLVAMMGRRIVEREADG